VIPFDDLVFTNREPFYIAETYGSCPLFGADAEVGDKFIMMPSIFASGANALRLLGPLAVFTDIPT
jgi:hypothetical protein